METLTLCMVLLAYVPAGEELRQENEVLTFVQFRAEENGGTCELTQEQQVRALPCGARLVIRADGEEVPRQWVSMPCRAPGNIG